MNASLAAFVDTHVLVYAVSDDKPEKQGLRAPEAPEARSWVQREPGTSTGR